MKRTFGFLIAAAVIALAGNCFAVPVSFTSGTFYTHSLGDNIGSQYDILNIEGLSGTLDLHPGMNNDVALNQFDFTVGVNSNYAFTTSNYDAVWNLQLNTASGVVDQLFNLDINSSDTIHFLAGNVVYCHIPEGLLEIAMNDLSFTSGVGTLEDQFLTANIKFTPNPVPEPSTIALLGLGLAGVALYRRRS